MTDADEFMFVQPSKKQKTNAPSSSSLAPRQRTQAERRCRDDRVERTLTEHFSDFPVSIREHREVNGKTLRQSVADIIFPNENVTTSKRLSPQQIGSLRLKFAVGDIAEAMLLDDPKDTSAPMSKRFEEAIAVASCKQSNKRDRGPLAAVLRTTTVVNVREVKALLRVCTPLRATASQELTTFIVGVMQWLVARGVHLSHQRLVDALRQTWDDALCALYSLAQRADENIVAWHSKFGGLLCLVTSQHAEVKELLRVKGAGGFGSHLDSLVAVCGGSKVLSEHASGSLAYGLRRHFVVSI